MDRCQCFDRGLLEIPLDHVLERGLETQHRVGLEGQIFLSLSGFDALEDFIPRGRLVLLPLPFLNILFEAHD